MLNYYIIELIALTLHGNGCNVSKEPQWYFVVNVPIVYYVLCQFEILLVVVWKKTKDKKWLISNPITKDMV